MEISYKYFLLFLISICTFILNMIMSFLYLEFSQTIFFFELSSNVSVNCLQFCQWTVSEPTKIEALKLMCNVTNNNVMYIYVTNIL